MSYVARDDRPADKADRYAEVEAEVLAVLEGEPNLTARMATVASMLADAFDDFFWTGFYRLVDEDLIVGPYQGPIACLLLERGKGVCWAGVRDGRPVLVPDVHALEDHIACDARSQSEVVIPVLDSSGQVVAVLDVDSDQPEAFNQADVDGLVRICALIHG